MEVEKSSSGGPPSPPPLISHNTGVPVHPVCPEDPGCARDGQGSPAPTPALKPQPDRPRSRAEGRTSPADAEQESQTMPSASCEPSANTRTEVTAPSPVEDVRSPADRTSTNRAGKEAGHQIPGKSKDATPHNKAKSPPTVTGKTKPSPSIMSSLKSKKSAGGGSSGKVAENSAMLRFVHRGPDSDSDGDEVPLNVLRDARRDSPSVESTVSTGSREASQRQRKSQSKSQSEQSKPAGQRTNGVPSGGKGTKGAEAPSSVGRTGTVNGDTHRNSLDNFDTEKVKKRRGRPPKQPVADVALMSRPLDREQLNMPNVSPDSGIQSIAGSPLTHDREVPSPGHHHPPAVHNNPHPALPFPPEFLHRLYPHLNPMLYSPPFAPPFFMAPAAVNFQQAFLNFTQHSRVGAVAASGAAALDHAAVKQSQVPRSKSSEELNAAVMKQPESQSGSGATSSSGRHSKSAAAKPDKNSDRPGKAVVGTHAPASKAMPSAKQSNNEAGKETVPPPVKKRSGRGRKNPDSSVPVPVHSGEGGDSLPGESGATEASVLEKTKSRSNLSNVSASTSAKSSPKHAQASGDKPKRGRPPKDASRQKQAQAKSTHATTATASVSNPFAYLTTAPVATNSLPGANRKTSDPLLVSIPSTQSLIPKDSAIALATSFPGLSEQEFVSQRKSPPQSATHLNPGTSRAAGTLTSSAAQMQNASTFGGTIGLPPKKKRGRPRKNPLPEDLVQSQQSTTGASPKSTASQLSRDSGISPNNSCISASSTLSPTASTGSTTVPSCVPIIPKSTKKTPIVAPSSFGHGQRPAASIARKRFKSGGAAGADAEILSLAQNIHESINAQFTSEDEFNSSSENLERNARLMQRNLFTDINHDFQRKVHGRSPLLVAPVARADMGENASECSSSQGSENVKKKPKKPRLHVMMQKPKKRGRKKKVPPVATSSPKPKEKPSTAAPTKTPVSVSPKKRGRPVASTQRKTTTVAKVKARSGKSENSDSGMTTDASDLDKTQAILLPVSSSSPAAKECSTSPGSRSGSQIRKLKNKKKKKKPKLYMKSKHKNIVDPVFLAALEGCTQDLGMMAISANPEHYLMRLQPGEVPMPSMFKIHRFIVKRRKKNKDVHLGKFRRLESKKDYADFAAVVREKSKRGRKKKFLSEEYVSEKEDDESHVNVEQCLPPKKRHKLLAAVENEPLESPNMRMGSENEPIVLDFDEPVAATSTASAASGLSAFAAAGVSHSSGLSADLPFSAKPGEKRKVGRPRKNPSQSQTELAEAAKEKNLPTPSAFVPLSGKNTFSFYPCLSKRVWCLWRANPNRAKVLAD